MEELFKLLADLPGEIQQELNRFIDRKEFEKGEHLVKIGFPCRYLYFIESGLVRTYCINDEGKEINIEFSIEGQFITSIDAFYNQSASQVGIQSLEDTTSLCIGHDALNTMFDRYPELNKIGRILTEQNFVRREKWHAHKFLMDAGNRYNNLLKNFPELIQRVPLQHLASYLGMSKEHLSRIRANSEL